MTEICDIRTQRLPFQACDLMVLGGGLDRHDDTTYRASAETNRRADTAGEFWNALRLMGREALIQRIIASGGYPQLAQKMLRPEDGTNEGGLVKDRLRRRHGATEEIVVDPDSEHTFGNFANSLNAGLLRPQLYTPEYRLGLVTSAAHARRVILLARYTMNLSAHCLFRVEPSQPETDPEVWQKEQLLAKLTYILPLPLLIRQLFRRARPDAPNILPSASLMYGIAKTSISLHLTKSTARIGGPRMCL